jgi:FtsP/CotA-like multicopper oxidase with cupredoxin domain
MEGPAERADVIIDFSRSPNGSKIILYNDAPAPVPAFDPRNDYYTGDPDQASTGGAHTTAKGFGPNTRTIMQFRVSGPQSPAFNLKKLSAALPAAFAASQPAPVVPEAAYGPAYGTTFPNKYARIESTSLTFTPIGSASPTTMDIRRKAIQELFELNYGRMNAVLGTELQFTNFNTQTTIPLAYVDPSTENIHNDEIQIWKITHNGVDTHAIHFHLFNVQLINRVGWDGAIRPPEANELGWKETVRMNPLEDAIVALWPVVPRLPFSIPNSQRLYDPTNAPGSTGQFTGVDPDTNNPITVTNDLTDFGWEYVWHCHLLGHEENDMMRPVRVENIVDLDYVTPVVAPSDLAAASPGAQQIDLSWSDNSGNETGFRIERATGAGAFVEIGTVAADVTAYSDTTVLSGTFYSYRVIAFNVDGDSLPSNTVTIRALAP